jgi:phosphate transport system permease protein
MSPEAKSLFMGYMRCGSQLRGFIKQKMDAAIEIRDQHITNENLRETLRNYANQIEQVDHYNYRLNDEARAQFILRLKDYIRANSLNTAKISSYEALIAELETGRSINTEQREIFLQLLRDQYKQIEKTIVPLDFEETISRVTDEQARYAQILRDLEQSIEAVLAKADAVDFQNPELSQRIERFKELNTLYLQETPQHRAKLADWDQQADISLWRALGAFLTGKEWITASDQQDWYGLLPLLSGSLLISAIALFFAIPLGVGAAIYVNQVAGPGRAQPHQALRRIRVGDPLGRDWIFWGHCLRRAAAANFHNLKSWRGCPSSPCKSASTPSPPAACSHSWRSPRFSPWRKTRSTMYRGILRKPR